MKNCISLLLSALLLLTLIGCKDGDVPVTTTTAASAPIDPAPTKDGFTLPPARMGESTSSVLIANQYTTFQGVFNECDAIARIRIGNWTGESTDSPPVTYYEATVLETYYGTLSDSITVQQTGNSKITLSGYPLFTAGNEFFVFLKATDDDSPADYWLPGSYLTVSEYAADSDGTLYFADRFNTVEQSGLDIPDKASDALLFRSISNAIDASDALGNSYRKEYTSIYSIDDLLAALSIS